MEDNISTSFDTFRERFDAFAKNYPLSYNLYQTATMIYAATCTDKELINFILNTKQVEDAYRLIMKG